MINKNILSYLFILIFLLVLLINLNSVEAVVYGANISFINSSTANTSAPTSIQAMAGNVTEMNVFGYSTTNSWQGYFGNVTGVVQLGDSSGNVLYNWSSASPTGQIYATSNGSVSWTYIQCFNYTANGTNCATDLNNGGNISLCGMNLTTLENSTNISSIDVDGVNETFNLNNHALFYSNRFQFASGKCKNTKVYGPNGVGTFDEVLLYSPDSRAVIFASILQRDVTGFDSRPHDFEMLVLENGHNGDITPTTYFFYLELQ